MNFSDRGVTDSKLIKKIVKNYNTLDYVPKLRGLVNLIYPQSNLSSFCKLDLHKKINDLILDGYDGEQILKYRLFNAFRESNVVAAYEIKVKNSRLDFLTINGHTTSYEIKSNLDNLDKLAKQSSDYVDAFEFNNIVIHERHLNKCRDIIPRSFGIITANKSEHAYLRKPIINRELNPGTQLGLLTKKELIKCFGERDVSEVLVQFSPERINELFKLTLKSRYQNRWHFIVEHAEQILPIDIQFFFNKNINPMHIYS